VAETIAVDVGSAITALATLRQAAAAAIDPVRSLTASFAQAAAAARQNGAAALAAFRADMQAMVAEHAISRQQALGFDIAYTAQRSEEERAQLEAALAADSTSLAEKAATYADLVALSGRYQAQLAQDQKRLADTARQEADRFAQPYREAFDTIGAGWRSAVTGLLERTISFQTATLRAAQSVERGFIEMVQTTLSRAAAGPLASLLGQGAPAAGEGVGDVLGNAVSRWLFGGPQQLGAAAATTANTAALAANTAALGTLTAALGATATAGAASGTASLAGGTAAAGAAAGSGGLFGWLGSLFSFAQGGIVPSAAGGWALPNFLGARPALLHAREMVLPAPISDGLQQMIAAGGGGGDMHLHFHGPSDGPAVERWFTGLMARNPGVVRSMLRSNALTPRTL
jgi:hypothetical protein